MSYTAGEFSKAFLQFLLVVRRLGGSNLRLDLVDASVDGFLVAGTIDDGGVVFSHSNSLGCTEHVDGSILQLDTLLLADDGSTGEDSYILEHLFAAVAKARCLHGADLELCTQTVYNQCRQRFAIYILSDDEQRTTTLYGGFQNR